MWSRAARTTPVADPRVAVHAEANALLHAGADGCKGSTLYITCAPCDGCLRLIAASGVARVIYPGMENG
jgi:dCMP deaminase